MTGKINARTKMMLNADNLVAQQKAIPDASERIEATLMKVKVFLPISFALINATRTMNEAINGNTINRYRCSELKIPCNTSNISMNREKKRNRC
ncbi:MAG: hypothetical protein QXQ80_00140 [Nitrososphaerota archaeon]